MAEIYFSDKLFYTQIFFGVALHTKTSVAFGGPTVNLVNFLFLDGGYFLFNNLKQECSL